MEQHNLIAVTEFCTHHQVETSIVQTLEENGLIHTILVQEIQYLEPDQLAKTEQLLRLHQELNVRVEDMDIIDGLLQKMNELNRQVSQLRHELDFFRRYGTM